MTTRTPQDVQTALEIQGLDTQIHFFDSSTATAQEAADSIGVPLGSIVKSLCFLIDDAPVVVLVSGDRRADERKLARHYGISRKRVRIADRETTEQVTGYAPGGVPPVGHAQELPVLIDQTLARFETVHAAAGSAFAAFPVRFERLVDVTQGQVIDLARE